MVVASMWKKARPKDAISASWASANEPRNWVPHSALKVLPGQGTEVILDFPLSQSRS